MGFGDGSGISWTICKQSAPRSRQVTTPAPHHSNFYRLYAPNQQYQSTEGNFKQITCNVVTKFGTSRVEVVGQKDDITHFYAVQYRHSVYNIVCRKLWTGGMIRYEMLF